MEKKITGKTLHKLLVILFMLVMVLSGVCFLDVKGDEVIAADSTGNVVSFITEEKEVAVYRDSADKTSYTYPKPSKSGYEDWIFAGWYEDEAGTIPYTEETITGQERAYAKYVPSEILSAKCQVTAGTDENSENTNMRFVSTVDSGNYSEVGFEITCNGKTLTFPTTTVFKRINSAFDGLDCGYSPVVFDTESEYFMTFTITNIANKNFDRVHFVRPYWVTMDGTTVYGMARNARVSDSYNRIANIPVRLYSDASVSAGALQVAYDSSKFEYVGYEVGNVDASASATNSADSTYVECTLSKSVNKPDGMLVNLRFKLIGDVTSNTTFDVTNTDIYNEKSELVSIASVIHKTYSISYNGNNADTSWYDEFKNDTNQKTFVIATAPDFYGFANLVNSGNTFAGKTIYVGADITVNSGTDTSSFAYKDWPIIASTSANAFQGTFDGQDHTISGIYASGADHVALFGYAHSNSVIKNFRLQNSYFYGSGMYVSSIAARGNGYITDVYSKATVEGDSYHLAGFVAEMTGDYGIGVCNTERTIHNSWFAGTVIMKNSSCHNVGGFLATTSTTQAAIKIENCLFTGTLKNEVSTTAGGRVAGFVGGFNGTVPTIKDCLSAGTIVNKGTTTGSYVGYKASSVNLTLTNVYAVKESCLSGDTHLAVGGKADSNVMAIAETNFKGFGGYTAALDFDKYWSARKNDVPVLTCFAESVLMSSDKSWTNNKTTDEMTGKDVYTISDLEDLYAFVQESQTNSFANAIVKLDADITVNSGNAKSWSKNAPKNDWIPIGQNTAFAGTFDGQGHTISGIYTSENNSYVGLFGKISGATILNLTLSNSYFMSTTHGVGGLAGYGYGAFEKVYSDAIVATTDGSNIGGFIGWAQGGNITFSECWFNGAVEQKNAQYDVGGFVGKQLCNISLEHCLSSGTIYSAGQRIGGIVGRVEGKDSAKVSLYIRDTLNHSSMTTPQNNQIGTILGSYDKATIDVGTTTHGVNVGYIPSGLQVVTEDNIKGFGAYGTNLDMFLDATEPYWIARQNGTPVLSCFAEGGLCAPDISWFNEVGTDVQTGKVLYTISDAFDLYGFAYLSQTNTFANSIVRMTMDITVNKTGSTKWEWIPISATTAQAFQGTFDGQGYTISGIHAEGSSYIALFAYAHTDSVIQNFRLEDSSFCATGSFSYASSIAARGNGTIENVYSSADVEGSGYHVAGFVAEITGDYNATTCRTIKNCWFDGTVTLLNKDCHNVGGFIATTSTTTASVLIEDCIFTGTLTNEVSTTAGGRVGGFVGGFNGTNTTIRDCLSAGTIINKGTTSGSIVGYNGAKSLKLSNVYAVTESCLSGTTHVSVGGNANASVIDMSKNDMKGETGYTNVLLSYDRTETANVVEGEWVVRKNDVPALKAFVKTDDIYDITGLFRADSRWYDTPSYTEEDGTKVYVISNIEELMGLSSLVSDKKTFAGEKVVLGADITMYSGDYTTWGTNAPGTVSWTPIGSDSSKYFAGMFDGQGYTISGIYCSGSTQGIALFGYIHPNGTVQNLKLKDSYFASTVDYVGSIAGWGLGTIQNVYSNAYVSGANSCGGLVAYISNEFYQARNDEKISNCWFDGNVTISGINAGGVIGKVRYSSTSVTIEHCYNSGNIHSSASSYGRASGFVGDLQSDCTVIIRDSLTTGNLTGSHVGKIFGCIEASSVADVGTNSTYAISGANKGADTKMVGHLGSLKTGTAVGEVTLEQLTGYNACNNTGLDFYLDDDNAAYWTVRKDGTPVLTTFAEEGLYVLDTSWYDDGTLTATTYTLDSVADLYGLAMLSTQDNFEGDTIVVSANVDDFVVNEGSASTYKTTAPRYDWIPIGGLNNAKTFKGNFNGNGVTISGIYCDIETNHTGLFAGTQGCTIQNLRLVNSYFATAANYAGSISSYTNSLTLKDVYSDAVVDCDGQLMGGFIGNVDGSATSTTIKGCWFDGVVNDVVPTGNENYSMAGGLVGKVAVNVTLNVTDSLNSGAVFGARRVGGLVGDSNYNATLNFTNCMNTGVVKGSETVYTTVNKKSATADTEEVSASIATAGYPAGSLVGYVTATSGDNHATKVTFTNTFGVNDNTSFAIGNNVISVNSSDVTGEAVMSARSALLGYADLINIENNAFVLTKVDGILTTGVAQFVPESERVSTAELDELLALATLNKSISHAVDKGDANYVITLDDSNNLYQSYVDVLQTSDKGFTLKKNNADTTLFTEGTYNAVLTKDEWVVSVTHVGNNVNKTYVTINCTGQEVSPHLNGEMEYRTKADAEVVGYTAESDLNVSFHMLQKCWTYGNGFVIQLKNGHFIVIDGGVEQELPYILDYMDSLCEDGTVPIVEAWVISHTHRDHVGALIELIKYSKEGYAAQGSSGGNTYYGDRLYVEGIYYSEVAQELVEKEDADLVAYKYQYNTIIEQASAYLKSTDGSGTKVYRPQAGQRYYFDGVTIDIILTQEQMDIMLGATQSINDTSTWCMFTMDAGNNTTKTILCGGDGYERNMQYLVDAFASNTTYFNVDVMTALHHGANKYDNFMKLCKVSTIVLFDQSKLSESLNIDSLSSEYQNYESLFKEAANRYKKSGDGNVALLFGNANIEITQTERTEWKYCEKLY